MLSMWEWANARSGFFARRIRCEARLFELTLGLGFSNDAQDDGRDEVRRQDHRPEQKGNHVAVAAARRARGARGGRAGHEESRVEEGGVRRFHQGSLRQAPSAMRMSA